MIYFGIGNIIRCKIIPLWYCCFTKQIKLQLTLLSIINRITFEHPCFNYIMQLCSWYAIFTSKSLLLRNISISCKLVRSLSSAHTFNYAISIHCLDLVDYDVTALWQHKYDMAKQWNKSTVYPEIFMLENLCVWKVCVIVFLRTWIIAKLEIRYIFNNANVPPKMEGSSSSSTVTVTQFSSCIRGYHIYQSIWLPSMGEILDRKCRGQICH